MTPLKLSATCCCRNWLQNTAKMLVKWHHFGWQLCVPLPRPQTNHLQRQCGREGLGSWHTQTAEHAANLPSAAQLTELRAAAVRCATEPADCLPKPAIHTVTLTHVRARQCQRVHEKAYQFMDLWNRGISHLEPRGLYLSNDSWKYIITCRTTVGSWHEVGLSMQLMSTNLVLPAWFYL